MNKILLILVFLVSCSSAYSAPPPAVTAAAYHPDGKLLAAGTLGKVALIDPVKGEVIAEIDAQTDRVTALAFNKSGDRLAVASGEPAKSGAIRLYEINEGKAKLLSANPAAHKDIIYALTFSPDGKLLASAGYDRTIKLWNPMAKGGPRLLQDHSDTIYGLSFHPDGKLLASAAADRAVKVWDIETGKRLYTLGEPTDWVYAVAWSPDGKHLAATGIDKSIRIWEADAEGGKLVHSVFAHTQPITRLVYSNEGATLYSVGEGKNLKSWDTATMKEKFVFPPQNETMLCLALHPNQRQLAVGRFDGVLVLLDASTGKTTAEPLPAKPKPPVLQKLTPDAGVRGTTVRVAFEGQHLAEATQATSDVPGVQIKLIAEGRTSTRAEADVTLPADANIGKINLFLKAPLGTTAPMPFAVDRYPVINETGARDSPRIGLKVKLPATLVGSIHKAGDADYFRFDVKAGDEISVQALTSAIGSKLEPILELTDANGKVLAESANGLLGHAFPSAGTYAVGIRDKDFRGHVDFTYRLNVGNFPLVTGAFPLGIERGTEAQIELRGVNLDKRRVTFSMPKDAEPNSKHRLQLPKSSEAVVGEVQIVAGEFPETLTVVGKQDFMSARATISVPGTANGVILLSQDTITFPAKKGQRLIVEVDARRLGSPLDSFIEIVDDRDKPVQRAALRCVARTFSTFRDNDSAASGIRLEAWNDLVIDDYLYMGGELMRIKQMPKGPDDDCQFYQVAGQRQGFLDTTPTHHALGTPMYKVEFHPPGSTFPPNGLPVFNLDYRNDDGGQGYGKDSRIFFDPPADGMYRVRIRDSRGQGGEHFAYRLTVRPPKPDFSVAFSPMDLSVWKGGSVPVNVTATRIDGFDGPIDIKINHLPKGFEAPPTFIEVGQMTTVFPVYASAAAEIQKQAAPLEFNASASVRETRDDRVDLPSRTLHSQLTKGGALKVLEPGDIVTTTNVQEVTIKPGQETKLLVTVERRNGFAGRIPLDVRGLPHGVRVQNIGLNGILITERDTQREVVLYAETWVKPMERPLIVLATREGKKTEHGAKPVMLKVAK